ncbi:MAG: carbohydrate-binding domain-containing protein [Oscillospiraceae bacterium]|nr:carbohydrate-binding domain-containing protein [Oscillospiraceae bacterium]
MRKKIIGLLLVLCLIVGLLPMTALADEPKTAKVCLLTWTTLTATEGGEAVYYKNESYEAYTKDGAANGTCWKQVVGTKDDWNVKFEYPTGGTPTLTLKDAKLDQIGDDGKVTYTKKVDSETGAVTYGQEPVKAGIISATGSFIDLKVVLQGDNHIDCAYGVIRCDTADNRYFKNITITGENGGKLTGQGRQVGISLKKGYNLTFENAIVDISTTSTGGTCIPILTNEGNITITGGHITASNTKNVAIEAKNGGNITITDAKVTATSKLISASNGSGTICASNNVTVSGNSELILNGENNPGLTISGEFNMNGGKLSVTSTQYGVACGSNGMVKINGGTVEVTAKNAFDVAPFLSDKVTGVAGATLEFAETYDGDNYLKPYILLTDTPSILPTVVPTEPPTTAPTVPAPTQAPTKAPTTAATKAPTQTPAATTNNQAADSTDGSSSDMIIYIAAAAVLVIAAAAIALILIKRKKA